MRIIEPSFSLSTPFGALTEQDGIKMLQHIERQARISHRSEDRQTEDTYRRFLQNVVMDHGDFSVIEHSSVTATIRTDRGTSHQLVRSRLFSFTQESTRFVRYDDNLEFLYPEAAPNGCFAQWDLAIQKSEETYLGLLKAGWRPQEARSVLPTCLATTIAVTGNLRVWRTFFLSRVSKETQADFRRIAQPMLLEFQRIFPILFDDIVMDARQIENARKAR